MGNKSINSNGYYLMNRPLKFVPKIAQATQRNEISRGEFTYNNVPYYGLVIRVQGEPYGIVNGRRVALNDTTDAIVTRNSIYESLTKFNPTKWIVPVQEYRKVTDEERAVGVITRHLFRKRTTGEFVETAKTRKITPNDSAAINGSLYESIEVPWKIAGEEFDVRLANEITLTKFEQYYPGIKKYLSDYLEFYRK